jgi:hypothetical protein
LSTEPQRLQVPLVVDQPSCIFVFTRDANGQLVRANAVPFSPRMLQEAVSQSELNLHGMLEYPLGSTPYPIALSYHAEKVQVVTHPTHTLKLPQESVEEIARRADEELKRKYGNHMPTTNTVLSLKLRGKTPHDNKAAIFDSADWAATLRNVAASPDGQRK